MLNTFTALISPPSSTERSTRRVQRRAKESYKSHFGIKDTATKVGVLACLIAVAFYPKTKEGEAKKKRAWNDGKRDMGREKHGENNCGMRESKGGRENHRTRKSYRQAEEPFSGMRGVHDKTNKPKRLPGSVQRLPTVEATKNIHGKERNRPKRTARLLSFEESSVDGNTTPTLSEAFNLEKSNNIGDGIRVRPGPIKSLDSFENCPENNDVLERPAVESSDFHRNANSELKISRPASRLTSSARRLSQRIFDYEWSSPDELERKR